MTTNTVFIIGAGASKEANLPTGHELKSKISRLLDIKIDLPKQVSGDYLITEALRRIVQQPDGRGGDINPYLYEAWHIRDAFPQAISIDNFIDSQRENEKIAICGKLAIVKSILEAEKGSTLYIRPHSDKPSLNYSALDGSWYNAFFKLLTENCSSLELEDRFQSITLIIFNYDRCVEHYLINAVMNYYRIKQDEAANLIGLITIFHPYGSVGKLPLIERNGSIGYGDEVNSLQLLELSNGIRTFAEGTDADSSNINAIRCSMAKADKVVFIGFAFHKLNMSLISPRSIDKRKTPLCYATALGISESDKHVVTNQIRQLYNANLQVHISSVSCREFFDEYWRSLSF